MILIVDNTTEQASKLDVSFQLDFYLNKQANMHPAWSASLNSFYIPSMASEPVPETNYNELWI